MSDPLATYLHDHLAGAVHAIDLLVAAPTNARLQNMDFEHLVARAEVQHAHVETHRMELARTVFHSAAEGSEA
jgi:hypothetical protein